MSCVLLIIVTIIVITVDSAPKYRHFQNQVFIPDIYSNETPKVIADESSSSDDYLINDSNETNLRNLSATTVAFASDNSIEINLRNLSKTRLPAGLNGTNTFKYSEEVTVPAELDNSIAIYLRSLSKTTKPAGSEGYVFDENICKEVNGRILCGYDKNKEEYNEATIDDLGNDCSVRGDRIECGYKVNQRHTESPNLRENEKPIEKLIDDRKISLKEMNLYSDEIETMSDQTQLSVSENTDASLSPNLVNKTINVDMRALNIDPRSEEVVTNPNASEVTNTFTTPPTLTTIFTTETKASNHEIYSKIGMTFKEMQSRINGSDAITSPLLVTKESTEKTSNGLYFSTVATPASIPGINSTTVKINVTASIMESTLIDNENEIEVNQEIIYLNGTEEDFDHQRLKRHTSDEILKTPVTIPTDGFTSIKKYLPTKLKLTKEETRKVKTVCVEQEDRIVCYDLLEG